jgi:hypothetical protein
MGEENSQKVGLNSAIASSLAPFFENASTLGLYLAHKSFEIFGRYLVFIMNMHQSDGS